MSVETLRRAAALMRERAEAAEACHPSPWTVQREGQWEWSVRDADKDAVTWEVPEHIAGMHPAVALAVANWLDSAASMGDQSGEPIYDAALAVARAYLGEDQ